MECRKSGLSDYQWCRENGVSNSTFYNWVKKLRGAACQEAHIVLKQCNDTPVRQEVVKVNLLPKDESTSVLYPSKHTNGTEAVSIELNLNGCNIKVHNNADPTLLAHTIHLLRGVL